jgi:dihydroorotate dehydrogenase
MSGPATASVGREQLMLWHDQTYGELDIVSALGIDTGKELARRLELGAVAGSGVTFLWRSKDWQQAVDDLLTDFVNVVEGGEDA